MVSDCYLPADSIILGRRSPVSETTRHPPSFRFLLLIRLFQVTSICSIGRCLARPSQNTPPVSAPVRQRGGLPAVPGHVPLARRLQVSAMCPDSRLRAGGTKTLGVCRLLQSSFADLADGASQYQDPADPLVVGSLHDDHRQAGCFGTPPPAPAWASALRNGLDDPSQAPPSDGQCRARTASGRGRDRRYLGWRTQAGLRGSRQLKGRRAALVLVAVEKRGQTSGRIRMAVLPDFKATTINPLPHPECCSRLYDLHRWP